MKLSILCLLTFLSTLTIFAQSTELESYSIGKKWVYVDTTYIRKIAFPNENFIRKVVDTYSVKFNNEMLSTCKVETSDDQGLYTLVGNNTQGIYHYGIITNTDTLIVPSLIYKYPVQVGDTSIAVSISIDDEDLAIYDTSIVTCISINEKIKTPAGDFTCILYFTQLELTDSTVLDLYDYFVPGLGEVASIQNYQGEIFRKRLLLNCNNYTGINSNKKTIENFTLKQNYPNPFNPSTNIEYSLKTESLIKIIVYNSIGETIATLVHKKERPGNYSVIWNGKDENGQPVSSGIYFYKLISGEYSSTKKMILVK